MAKRRKPDPMVDNAQGIAECARSEEHVWADAGCELIPFSACVRCGKIARYAREKPK